MHRVVLRVSHLNAPSQALSVKGGFQLEGVLRQDYQDALGQLHNTHVYGLLATDDEAKTLVADASASACTFPDA